MCMPKGSDLSSTPACDWQAHLRLARAIAGKAGGSPCALAQRTLLRFSLHANERLFVAVSLCAAVQLNSRQGYLGACKKCNTDGRHNCAANQNILQSCGCSPRQICYRLKRCLHEHRRLAEGLKCGVQASCLRAAGTKLCLDNQTLKCKASRMASPSIWCEA